MKTLRSTAIDGEHIRGETTVRCEQAGRAGNRWGDDHISRDTANDRAMAPTIVDCSTHFSSDIPFR